MEIGYEKCEVASLDMDDFVEGKSYRLVVQRSPLKDKDGSRLRNLSPDPPWTMPLETQCGEDQDSAMSHINLKEGRRL